MSIALSLDIGSKKIQEIIDRCTVKPTPTQYNLSPPEIPCYATNVKKNEVYVPLSTWPLFYETFPNKRHAKASFTCKKQMYTLDTDPKGKRDQDVVVKAALKRLHRDHVAFIAAFPGFGKTSCGNYISSELGLKTAIVCHLDSVNEQWIDEYTKFSTATVQRVRGSKAIDPRADVLIFGVKKAELMSKDDLSDIGLVIFDEAHISTVTALTKSLLKFRPKYLLGLSATPKRTDGLHSLLYLSFGPRKTYFVREETKEFKVIGYFTKIKPTIEYMRVNGQTVPKWSTLVNSLAASEELADLIVGLVLKHPKECILILSDRIIQSQMVYDKLIELGEDAALSVGKSKIDRKLRVLVSSLKKCGTGFDRTDLTMLIIACDVKADLLQQYEGRVRCDNNIIYHFVHDNRMLHNHWNGTARAKGCRDWYEKRGATIEIIDERENFRSEVVPSRRLLPPQK